MWILVWQSRSRSRERYVSTYPYFTDDPDLQTVQPYTNKLDKAKVFRTKDEAERFAAELDDASNLDAVCKSTELAEGDLLGELIEASRAVLDHQGAQMSHKLLEALGNLEALLSRLPEPKGKQ